MILPHTEDEDFINSPRKTSDRRENVEIMKMQCRHKKTSASLTILNFLRVTPRPSMPTQPKMQMMMIVMIDTPPGVEVVGLRTEPWCNECKTQEEATQNKQIGYG